jgi:hypothetical protein
VRTIPVALIDALIDFQEVLENTNTDLKEICDLYYLFIIFHLKRAENGKDNGSPEEHL